MRCSFGRSWHWRLVSCSLRRGLSVMACEAPLSHLRVLISLGSRLLCGPSSVELPVQHVTALGCSWQRDCHLLPLSVRLRRCWLPAAWNQYLLTFEESNMNAPCPSFYFGRILNLSPAWLSSSFISVFLTNVQHKQSLTDHLECLMCAELFSEHTCVPWRRGPMELSLS